MGNRKLLALTTTTATAQKAAQELSKTRAGRDMATRVGGAIKVVDTHSRQWNRYSP